MTSRRGMSKKPRNGRARMRFAPSATLRLAGIVALASSHSVGDGLLVGAGVAMAGASAVFAGVMVARDDGPPRINGMEYLAIFSQPSGASAPTAVASAPLAEPDRSGASDEVDRAPTGSIARAERVAPMPDDGFHIIAGRRDFVWMRRGQTIRAVRPGDLVPGLGLVGSIEQRKGGWALLDKSGAVLLADDAAARPDPRAGRFSKSLIFD